MVSIPRLAPDDVEIEPGAKHFLRAADDDGANGFVVPRFCQRRQQRVDQRHAQRVDRGAVEHDLGDIARDGITNEFSAHDTRRLRFLGLTHRAGLDQFVDRAAIEARLQQHRNAILPDVGRRAQLILGKAGDARRARTIDLADAGRVLAHRGLGRLDVDAAQPFAGIVDALGDDVGRMQPRQPGFRRLLQENLAQLRDQRVGVSRRALAKSAKRGSVARSSRSIAAHSRLYCGSFTSVTIIQPSLV